jgi:purine-binding chemotaxis protein CheW
VRESSAAGPTGPGTAPRDLLVVSVADHRCALPLDAVVEVHAAVQLTPLPDAPDVVVGLVNRRGTSLPVLDLRRRLGLPPRPLHPADCLVAVRLPDHDVALLVDAALDLVTVPAEAVDTAVAQASAALYSAGVAVLPDGLLVVVDLTRFLSRDEAQALQGALHAPTGAAP